MRDLTIHVQFHLLVTFHGLPYGLYVYLLRGES